MLDAPVSAPLPLIAHCQQQIHQVVPFTHSDQGELRLFLPHQDYDQQQHERALQHLQQQGAIAFYRYIDSKPQPAILAVRA